MPNAELQQSLEAARQANTRGEAVVLMQLAGQALAQAEAAGDEPAAAEAGLLLARGCFSRGDYAACVRHGRAAFGLWQRRGDTEQACAALRVVAHGLYEGGALASALAAARQGFDLAEAHHLLGEAMQMLVLVGTLHGELQNFHDGEALLLQALSRAREMREPAHESLATSALMVLLGRALESHQREGRTEAAAAAAHLLERQALSLHRLAQHDPHRSRRAVFLGNAGEALGRCGRVEAAIAALAESLALAQEEGLAVLELATLGRLGRLQLARQDFEGAQRSASAMQQALQATPHAPARLDLLALQAQLQLHHGLHDEAAALQRQVVEARQARHRQAESLRRELDLATDARLLPARLHALETRD